MRKALITTVSFFATLAILFLTSCETETTYGGADYASVAIEASGTPTTNELGITITPNSATARVTYAIGSVSDRDEFLEGTLTSRTHNGSEAFTDTFTDLTPYKSYIIYAVAYDSGGNQGPLATIMLNTVPEEGLNISELFVSEQSAAFNIACGGFYNSFYFAVGKSSDKEAFLDGKLAGITRKKDVSFYTPTFFELDAQTDYVFFLSVMDKQGKDHFYEVPFKTLSPSECPSVTISNDPDSDVYYDGVNITCNSLVGKINVLTYNTVGGKLPGTFEAPNRQIRWSEEFANQSGNIMAAVDGFSKDKGKWYNTSYSLALESLTTSGKITYWRSGLYTNVTYVMYVVVYDKSLNPTSVIRHNYYSPVYDNTLPVTVVTNSTVTPSAGKVDFTATVDSNTKFVVYGIMDKKTVDDNSTTSIQLSIYTFGKIVYIKESGQTFSQTLTTAIRNAALKSGEDYYLIFQPTNANGYGYFVNGTGQINGFGTLVKLPFTY